jgi:NADH-quinone oxidoreductase subunit G
MCDEGRYGFHHVHSEQRLDEQRLRDGDTHVVREWTPLAAALDDRLRRAGHLGAVLSPHLTVEDAYLLAKYLRQIDPQAKFYLGPVPAEGEDETFKNGFTIRAEKCPTRRRVEAVLNHFAGNANPGGKIASFDDFLADAAAGQIAGAWITGGYKSAWHTAEAADSVAGLKLLIVQDMFDSPLWQRADFQLPGAAFAEREGSFVNFNDRLQAFTWAIRPPTGVRTEAHLAWQLLKMPGMYNARAVLSEIAAEIAFFATAGHEVPPTGIDLKVQQLASS